MYTVISQPGDCLCSIAQREGFSNCGSLRSVPANAPFLDTVLAPGSVVTIPQAWNTYFYAGLATGRRYTIRYFSPIPVPQPTSVRFVRTVITPPADTDAIANIGISRYITRSTDGMGANNWVDDSHRAYDQAACRDVNVFNIDVFDQNAAGADVVALVEAMMPIYAPGGARIGSQRFPAGPERDARSLSVVCSSVNGGSRHRSCYLRLVVDRFDKAVRPLQTVLVSDMVDGGAPETEILDQDIHVRYEYPACPRPAGQRCLLAEQTLPLRRGRSVELRLWILRPVRTGIVGTVANGLDDGGVVTRQSAIDRLQKNVRRIWAQEEIAFVIDRVETVDAPSDMLSISDPQGADSVGQGVIGFTLTLQIVGAQPANHVVAPTAVPAGGSPLQTAQFIKGLVDALGIFGLVCTTSQNPAIDGHVGQSADVLFSHPAGYVTLTQLTPTAQQDTAQKTTVVSIDLNAFEIRATANNAYVGSGMQRCLYKAHATNPQGVNVFVVQSLAGGAAPLAHTLNSQQHLPIQFRPLGGVENCIVISYEAMDPDLDVKPATLAHEIGHALIDNAEHSVDNNAEGSLMNASTSEKVGADGAYDTKRIIDWLVYWHTIVETANPGGPFTVDPPLQAALWIAWQRHSMHGQIANNQRINFQLR